MIGQALKRGAAALEVEAKVAKQPKGGSKGGGKGGRGKDKEKDSKSSGSKMEAGSEDGKLQILILKTLLKHSQQHRDAESVLFLTYLAPTSSFPILSARQQTMAYQEQVKTRGHGLGPPHLYAAAGLLQGFLEAGISTLGLKEMLDDYLAAPVDKRASTCLFCRVNKVYKADECRVTLAFGSNSAGTKMQEMVEAAIAALPEQETEKEWTKKLGRAPAGHQERELQTFPEALLAT